MSGEFDLIRTFFQDPWPATESVELGIGDDAALVNPHLPRAEFLGRQGGAVESAAATIVGASAMLVYDSATRPAPDPSSLAVQALTEAAMALAARGGVAQWMTLGLTLPTPCEHWLSAFSAALRARADEWGIALIGGDTTRGALTVAVFVQGLGAPPVLPAPLDSEAMIIESASFAPTATVTLVRRGWPVAFSRMVGQDNPESFAQRHGFRLTDNLGRLALNQTTEAAASPEPRILALIDPDAADAIELQWPGRFRRSSRAVAITTSQ